MKFTVLASGSKGNMTYIEFKNRNILIDAGIALPNAKSRVKEGLLDKVTDVFVTHEHIDHVKFLDTVLKRSGANLYIDKNSFYKLNSCLLEKIPKDKVKFIESDSHYVLGDIDVYTLKLSHDAISCMGYVFKEDDKMIGYVTDTGYFPVQYLKIASLLDAIIIEANHNIEMLMNSEREQRLKDRILSPTGHMSNYICLQVLKEIIKGKVKTIVLAHISEECNSIDCINEEIINPLKEIYQGEVLVAYQNSATKVIEL